MQLADQKIRDEPERFSEYAAELLLKADGVRHARGTAELAGARTPQLNHAFGVQGNDVLASDHNQGNMKAYAGRAARPPGVTLLSLFFAFGTGMALLACLLLLFPGSPLDPIWELNPRARQGFSAMGLWSVAFMALVSAACGMAAIGMWKGKRWAHPFAVVLLVVNVVGGLLNGLVGGDRRALLGIPIAGIVLAYLGSARVRGYFYDAAR